MKLRDPIQGTKPGRKSGFTLIEVILAATIFTVIGYALADAIRMGGNSQKAVAEIASSNRWVRNVHSLLSSELKVSNEEHITVIQLADGNTQLEFMHLIEAPVGEAWGVRDLSLGTTTAEQNREDWVYRYTVDEIPMAGVVVQRRLLRQLVDDTGAVQRTRVLVQDLRRGDAAAPGFAVNKVGEMWVIEVTQEGRTLNQPGKGALFHVSTRN